HTIQMQTNLAVLYRGMGLFWEAKLLCEDMLPYQDQITPDARFVLLTSYASLLGAIGDTDLALRNLDAAQRILMAYPDVHPFGDAWLAFERAGMLEDMGEYEQALEQIDVAIVLQEARGEDIDWSDWILYWERKGVILQNLENYPEAVSALRGPLERFSVDEWPVGLDLRGWAYEYLAKVYNDMGQQQAALTASRQAKETYRMAGNPWNFTSIYIDMAISWSQQSRWDSAFAYHQMAWEQALPDIPFSLSPNSKDLLQHWHHPDVAHLLIEQGQSLEARYAESQDEADWLAAIACYESELDLIDEKRRYYSEPGSRQKEMAYQLPVYERLLKLYAMAPEQPEYVWKALQLTARSKASNLRQHLQEQVALNVAGIPDKMLTEERTYRQRLLALEQSRVIKGPSDSVADLRFELHQQYLGFIAEMERSYPDYYQLKFALPKLDQQALKAYLGEQTLMYSYFWGREYLYVFRVSGEETRMYSVPVQDSLQANLDQWLNFVSQPPAPDMSLAAPEKAGQYLTKVLLPDLPLDERELFIVPHGKLALLPFESLPLHQTEMQDLRHWLFLGRKFPVRYAYAEALGLQATNESEQLSYLGFAPAFEGSVPQVYRDVLGPLTYNQTEVTQA
ncbi:MAG: tetratricopeptide repeat protein, partial [Bacteroidota bacterium]